MGSALISLSLPFAEGCVQKLALWSSYPFQFHLQLICGFPTSLLQPCLDNQFGFLQGSPQLLPPLVHLFIYVSSACADLLPQLLDFLQVGKGCPCALSSSALRGSFPWDPAKLRSFFLDLLTIYWILQSSLY